MKEFLGSLVKHNFPSQHIKYAFGYGSAVFKQANYQQDDKEQVIDAIFIVDDTFAFHKENMKQNQGHYSFYTKRLPVSATNWVNSSGSGMYFNPLIPMKSLNQQGDQRRFKYGIIQADNAVKDLTEWSAFAFAGRLHKPVLPFIEGSEEVSKAIETNRDHALHTALLLSYHKLELPLIDLATTICELSYKGDIRMRFKMENPDKVRNIVQGSYEGLNHLYGPHSLRMLNLHELGIVRPSGDKLHLQHSNKNLQYLFEQIPQTLKKGMKENVIQLSLKEIQEDVTKNLQKQVLETSINMIMSGLYSTNPLKNLSYVYSKFKKGRSKK